MSDAGPAASALDGIRERSAEAAKIADAGLTFVPMIGILAGSAADVPRLLKAVEAALKLADDLDAEAARLLATAARLRTGAATGTQNRAWAHRDCAEALREAITAALADRKGERLAKIERQD